MNVTLDPMDQMALEALARQRGAQPAAVLSDLVHEALTRHTEGAPGHLIQGTGRLPAELLQAPAGQGPCGVLDALLEERARGR